MLGGIRSRPARGLEVKEGDLWLSAQIHVSRGNFVMFL